MFCDDCGRFAPFRDRCADCEAEQLRRYARGETDETPGSRRSRRRRGSSWKSLLGSSLSRGDSSERSSFHSETHVHQSTSVKIVIHGKEVALGSAEGVTPELVQQLSEELDLPEAEIATLLASTLQDGEALGEIEERAEVEAREGAGAQTRETAGVRARGTTHGRRKGPLKRIHCPQCERQIPEREWCLYCGYEFQEQEDEVRERVEARDEVDERFLTEDVEVESEKAEEERVEERLRDSYRDRLEDL